MAFELQVEFSGLCLYVYDTQKQKVAVLLPDARKRKAVLTHVDGTVGEPHVGYLRYSLADLDSSFPQGTAREPAYEVVRLFKYEDLDFGVPAGAGLDVTQINVPDFARIAPDSSVPTRSRLELIDDLFSGAPPPELLMRTFLTGGTLKGSPAETWQFSDLWTPGQPYESVFASFVTWRRTIDAPNVTLTFRTHGGEPRESIVLAPANGTTVLLKVANFCDKNPMEWLDLGLRQVDHDDVDFKWMYRLVRPVQGTYATALNGKPLPMPLRPAKGPAGVEDCLGAQIGGTVPG